MDLLAITGRAGPPRHDSLSTAGRLRLLSRRFVGLFALVIAVFGFGVVASRQAAPPTEAPTVGDVAAAQRSIEALVDPRSGRDPIGELPADFSRVSGVVPGRALAPDGSMRAVHVDGGCSAPWGEDNTYWDFGVACRAHDFGYDILRYAEHKGQPLPATMRRQLDDRLSQDMYGQCQRTPKGSGGTCRIVAALYTAGLAMNSWHQRWGPPKSEPLGSWAIGLVVVLLLLAVRVFGLAHPRRAPVRPRAPVSAVPDPALEARKRFMSVLRVTSLVSILVGESLLVLLRWGDQDAAGLWPITWLLQAAPVLFFAGGHANLMAWHEVRAAGGDYGRYLACRISSLIRPVLAFVLAWLIVPLSLELLGAPEGTVAAVGRLVVQPLWLLGIFLLVVAACPLMHRLHGRFPVCAPLALAAATVAVAHTTTAPGYLYIAAVLFALLFGQLAVAWEEGGPRRLPRATLVGTAAAALTGLVLLTTIGGQPPLLMPDIGESVALAPSLACLLLLGVVQVGLLCTVRVFGPITTGRAWRLVGFLRSVPMTAYLVSVAAIMLSVGLVGSVGVGWLTRPGTWMAFLLLGLSVVLAFRWFERRPSVHPSTLGIAHCAPGVHAVAAALGVGFVALGIVGFAVTGPAWQVGTATLFGLPLDPLGNLIHLLVGWFLLHAVLVGTSGLPWPWLITAVACVPPMIMTKSGPGYAVHGVTIALALVASVVCMRTRRVTVAVA